jgi:4-amino-4-deoxy-L-arabinose transferase-like glycosyltransferase
MKKNKIWLFLLLIIYLITTILLNKPLKGDELRYIAYAENMANGFYTDSENPDLSNGPGYPIVLLPFVALDSNLLIPKILNAFFVFIGICYLYKTLLFYTKQKYALSIAFLIGLYPPLIRWMTVLYSESLSFLLVSGFLFYFCSLYHKKQNWKTTVFASFYLGFLVLTKVIFFHVIVVGTIGLTFLFLFKKQKSTKLALYVAIGAFIVASPFIIYAYSVTGKLFYLGTRGGEILYHRSTPFENEYGNWFSADKILKSDNEESPENLSLLISNHKEFYLQVQPLSNMQRDSAFKTKALKNMKAFPIKYLNNTIANAGRLLLGLPNSYQSQNLSVFGYIIPNAFIMVLLILIAWPAFLARKKIPFEIKTLLLFSLIYGAGMILLLGKPRYFTMMVPSLVLFLAYGYTHILEFKTIKRGAKQNV